MNCLLSPLACCSLPRALGQTSCSWSQPAGSSTDSELEKHSRPPTCPSQTPHPPLRWTTWLIAEGSIGNLHKLNFLVDTGACPSVVDQKIAHDLKLPEQPERVNLWNKSVRHDRLSYLP